MQDFPDLVRRHRVDPGHLVHVGNAQGREITAYYEAGFTNITVVDSAPERIRAVRTRFPGVEVREVTGHEGFRLDATTPDAKVAVVQIPGHELTVLTHAPWGSLDLLVVGTTHTDETPSPYDLVTEAVTTKGFVEVDRWTRSNNGRGGGDDLDVVFMKVAD